MLFKNAEIEQSLIKIAGQLALVSSPRDKPEKKKTIPKPQSKEFYKL